MTRYVPVSLPPETAPKGRAPVARVEKRSTGGVPRKPQPWIRCKVPVQRFRHWDVYLAWEVRKVG